MPTPIGTPVLRWGTPWVESHRPDFNGFLGVKGVGRTIGNEPRHRTARVSRQEREGPPHLWSFLRV